MLRKASKGYVELSSGGRIVFKIKRENLIPPGKGKRDPWKFSRSLDGIWRRAIGAENRLLKIDFRHVAIS